MTLQCFDHQGHLTTLDAIRQDYGPLFLQDADPPGSYAGTVYRLAEIHERRDTYAAIELTLLDEYDEPIEGVLVAWYWPDAPADSPAGPAAGVPEGMIPGRACSAPTNQRGKVGFPMGSGAFYKAHLGHRGPHAVWIHGENTHSDLVWGLGMRYGTAHDHLDLVFRAVPHQPAPEPEPDLWDELFARLDYMIEMMEGIT